MKLFEKAIAISLAGNSHFSRTCVQRPTKLRGQSKYTLCLAIDCHTDQFNYYVMIGFSFQPFILCKASSKHFYLTKYSNCSSETMLYPLCITAKFVKCKFSPFACFTPILYTTKDFELPKFPSNPSSFHYMQLCHVM